jgi:transcriptional regulator with XRE-family HTH domain
MRSLWAITRRAARASGMTQAELARRSGVSQPQISLYLRRKRDLNAEAWGQLARVLGIRINGQRLDG